MRWLAWHGKTLPAVEEEDGRPRGCFEVVAEDFPRWGSASSTPA